MSNHLSVRIDHPAANWTFLSCSPGIFEQAMSRGDLESLRGSHVSRVALANAMRRSGIWDISSSLSACSKVMVVPHQSTSLWRYAETRIEPHFKFYRVGITARVYSLDEPSSWPPSSAVILRHQQKSRCNLLVEDRLMCSRIVIFDQRPYSEPRLYLSSLRLVAPRSASFPTYHVEPGTRLVTQFIHVPSIRPQIMGKDHLSLRRHSAELTTW